MPLTTVREVRADGGAGSMTAVDIALPFGTQVGDAVAVIANGSIDSFIGTSSSDQFHTTINAPGGDPGAKFFFGVLTRLDPINVTVQTGTGVRSAHVQIITLTGTLDMSRTSMVGANASSVIVPPITGSSSGVLALVVAWAGIGGPIWNGVTGGAGWVRMLDSSAYHLVASAWAGDPAMSGAATASVDRADWMACLLVGVGLLDLAAPPCRLIRDDDLGVGGARLYPPPRSLQRSSRGVGYY